MRRAAKLIALPLAAMWLVAACACGYHAAGKGDRIPTTVKTIAIPAFINQTSTNRIEVILTGSVVQEFNTRTRFRIVTDTKDADAVLKGTVVSTQLAPVTYDSQTGRASTGLVTVTARVSLVSRDGTTLYENQNYLFREQYQISRELSSFFEEEDPAMKRLSRDFARSLVSDVLEAF
jgi:outer membrane lipopolysaccharide assembly protein LptE/RlpB